MKLYWGSLLIQDTEKKSKPWVCAMSDGCISLEQALKNCSNWKTKLQSAIGMDRCF